MQNIRHALRVFALILPLAALAGCGGGIDWAGSRGSEPAALTAAPDGAAVNLAGRWLFSSPGRGQCPMTFGAAGSAAAEGTIAPEGGCPGKFFTSRKWNYDQAGLTLRDHKGQVLAQLTSEGSGFQGKAASGEPVALSR
jgi:protease inhibitor Inh